MNDQSMNNCELTWVQHSLQVLKLTMAKLLNFLNRKVFPLAAIYHAPYDLVT